MFTTIIQDASLKCALAGAISLLLQGNNYVDGLIAGYFSSANQSLVSKGLPALTICYQNSSLKQYLHKQKGLAHELTVTSRQLEGDVELLESIVSDSMGITDERRSSTVASVGAASVGIFADQATLPNSNDENDKSYSKSKRSSP